MIRENESKTTLMPNAGAILERHEIEARALRIIRGVADNSSFEDSYVELKRDWPTDYQKAARQLAALANPARGSPVMWLIGVDEQQGIVGAQDVELANWWQQVTRWFDPPAPAMQNLVTYWQEVPVTVLAFDTAARPFVTKTDGGPFPSVVPWREGNRTRTATRAELIEILSPIASTPRLEILSMELLAWRPTDTGHQWLLELDTYVHQDTDSVLVLPAHRCSASVDLPEYGMVIDLEDAIFNFRDVGKNHDDGVVSGPGRLSLRLDAEVPVNPGIAFPKHAPNKPATVHLSLLPANSEHPITADESLNPQFNENYLGFWTL